MKINNASIHLDNGVDLPLHPSHHSPTIQIKVNKILKVFKGDKEVTGEKLQQIQKSFIERGYIKIRGFERILFGTGIHVTLPSNTELQIKSHKSVSLNQGITLLNTDIPPSSDGEIQIIAYNGTTFLTTVKLNQNLAVGTLKKVENLNFKLQENG